MQLGDINQKEPESTSSDFDNKGLSEPIGSIAQNDQTENSSPSTNQPKQNILSPTDSEVIQQSIPNTQSKRPNRFIKIVFSILIVLAIITFGVAVSLYLLRLDNSPLKRDSNSKDSGANFKLSLNSADQNVVNSDLGIDGTNERVINSIYNAVESYYKENGSYPWEDYGDKPIPAMNKILNPAGVPNFAWLDANLEGDNNFATEIDLNSVFEGEGAKELRMYGFASWYAVCFKPTTEEYLSKANYTVHAELVDPGRGEYICVRGDIVLNAPATQSVPTASPASDGPKSVFGNL